MRVTVVKVEGATKDLGDDIEPVHYDKITFEGFDSDTKVTLVIEAPRTGEPPAYGDSIDISIGYLHDTDPTQEVFDI